MVHIIPVITLEISKWFSYMFFHQKKTIRIRSCINMSNSSFSMCIYIHIDIHIHHVIAWTHHIIVSIFKILCLKRSQIKKVIERND